MFIYLKLPSCNPVSLCHLSAPLTITACLSNWTGPYLLQLSTSEPTIWFYQRADFDSVSEELETLDCDITQSDINYLWSNWKDCFRNVMTKYVPHKRVTIRKSLPWLTHALSLLLKKRDRLHHRAKTLNLLLPGCPTERPGTEHWVLSRVPRGNFSPIFHLKSKLQKSFGLPTILYYPIDNTSLRCSQTQCS